MRFIFIILEGLISAIKINDKFTFLFILGFFLRY